MIGLHDSNNNTVQEPEVLKPICDCINSSIETEVDNFSATPKTLTTENIKLKPKIQTETNQANAIAAFNRSQQKSLNIEYSTKSACTVPSSIRLHCEDENFEDRKNAEKRIHLYERRK